MNRQRVQKLLAASVAAALAVAPIAAFADGDGDAPEFRGITLYGNTTTLPGGEIELGLDAVDEDGMEKIVVRFQNESGRQLSFTLRETSEESDINERYGGTLHIPASAQAGVYQVKSVELTDREENISRYYYQRKDMRRSDDESYLLEGQPASFTVVRKSTQPVVSGCTLSRQEIGPGGTACLTFRLDGTPASLKKATLVFQNPVNGRKILCTADRGDRQPDGSYQVELEVPLQEPTGQFTLYRMSAEDAGGNKQSYSTSTTIEDDLPLPFSCGFTVTAGNRNNTLSKPHLELVEVTPEGAEGDHWNYRLRVQVSDNGIGIDHITVRFENPANGRTVSKVLKAEDGKNGVFTGTLEVKKSEPAGTFLLDNVGVTDRAKNYQAYCRPADVKEANHKLPLPQTVSFAVNSRVTGSADETAPVLHSVQVSPKTADTGKLIRVDAVVTDDFSGVDSVKLRFESYSGKAVSVDLVHREGNRFTGTLKGTKTKTGGTYRLVKAVLKDKAGNSRTYYDRPDGRNGELLLSKPEFTLQEDE